MPDNVAADGVYDARILRWHKAAKRFDDTSLPGNKQRRFGWYLAAIVHLLEGTSPKAYLLQPA